MTYRDNVVHFSLNGGYSLVRGSYTVTDFSVTGGQDPEGRIHAGLTVTCGSDGNLSFSVGRSGSASVAQWFNNQVPAAQTTFNHGAGELNFALLGTLQLSVTGGILGNGLATLTFPNVALAQGHSGLSNNWWFGGQHCAYIGNNQVRGAGTNAWGAAVSFVFLRGDNGVNEVGVTPVTLLDTANWMRNVNDSVRLDQLTLPGSHDAGMSVLSHCNPFVGAGGYTQTQSGSIGQQLADGSRYFDIRVDYDHDALVTYHRTGAFGCNGEALTDVLDQTRAFLTAHPGETAILKFSHIRDYGDHKPADIKQRINTLLGAYQAVIYQNPAEAVNLAGVTMGSVRGKMILVFDYDEYINPATGRFRYFDGSAAQPGATLTVYDVYSNTSDYNTMKTDQLQKWQQHGGQGQGYFFLLSWTLTASPPGSTIETLAAQANGNLPGVLYNQIVTARAAKPNIVYLDFVNNTTAQSIIQYNF